jgi:hypothetical protein
MCEEKQELTKEERIEKAKELMDELKDLELSEDDLKGVAGGQVVVIVHPSNSETDIDDEKIRKLFHG